MAPFNAIENVYEEVADIPYPLVAEISGSGEQSPVCQHNNVHISSTAGLQVYNLTAERQIFDGFKERIKDNFELARGTAIVHKGYSTHAVQNRLSAGSAYPFRGDHHLNLFSATISPDSGLDEAAWEWAREVADQWHAGQPNRSPSAYVNYANGFKTPEQMYGHDN